MRDYRFELVDKGNAMGVTLDGQKAIIGFPAHGPAKKRVAA